MDCNEGQPEEIEMKIKIVIERKQEEPKKEETFSERFRRESDEFHAKFQKDSEDFHARFRTSMF